MDDRYEMLPGIEAERDATYTREPVMRSRKKTETKKPPELSSIQYGTVWDDSYRPGDEQMPYDRERNRKVYENLADAADFATDFVPAMPAVKKLAKGESPDALDLVDFIPGGSQGKAAAKMAIIPIMGARGMDEFITHAAKRMGENLSKADPSWMYARSLYTPSQKDEFVQAFITMMDNLPEEARDNLVRELASSGENGVRFVKMNDTKSSLFNPKDGYVEIITEGRSPSRVASEVLHEKTHSLDKKIGDRFYDAGFGSYDSGIGATIQPVVGKFYKSPVYNKKSFKDASDNVAKYFIDSGANPKVAEQLTGVLSDARSLSPVNPFEEFLELGHTPEYRLKNEAEAMRAGARMPKYAASGLESLANTTQALGEKGGEEFLMKDFGKWFDAYMRNMKRNPFEKDELIIPERFRY